MKDGRGRVGAEAVLAFFAGAVWFALSGALLHLLPSLFLLILGVIALDVIVVLAIARYWGITAAVTVGVASVVALDWYSIPPTHTSTGSRRAELARPRRPTS